MEAVKLMFSPLQLLYARRLRMGLENMSKDATRLPRKELGPIETTFQTTGEERIGKQR